VARSGSQLMCTKINAGYKSTQVLFDVSIEVESGRICTIVGPNGSGKSTLLKTIFGLTTVYTGGVSFDGVDVTSKPPHEMAKIGVAYVPQTGNVFANLTGSENFLMAQYSTPKEEVQETMQRTLEYFPQVRSFLNRKVMTLSGGERQILCMAMALIRKPRLMMLDEPSGNLAPKVVSLVFQKIREINKDMGITIILVEQNARKALEESDDAVLLANGRVQFKGKAVDLVRHPELNKLYLGIVAA
jgi:branched-chain amino acid transport system ATP-binding protein